MAKEAVLTSTDRENLEIIHFIFHIIIAEEEEPHYLDEVVLTEKQKDFFRDRIIDASKGTQYLFIDKESNSMYENVCEIIDDPESNFLKLSKQIALDFVSHHKGNMSDGVFVISIIQISDETKLLLLLKIDHQRVLRYVVKKDKEGEKAIMEEILNTFVEDKNALQKGAIIDISDTYEWDVLGFDKIKEFDIAQYFRKFLMVVERDDASRLTKKTVNAVRTWYLANQQELSKIDELSGYKSRAISFMNSFDNFDTDSFVNMVVKDDDHNRKQKYSRSLTEYLEEQGIAGQQFTPKPSALTPKERKNIRETSEGVKIEWSGDADSRGISIPPTKNPNDNMYHITIKTSKISSVS